MENLEIKPAGRLSGVTPVAADKSISHRLAMIAAIAEGATTIHNFAESADCQSTLECLRNLGVKVEHTGSSLTIHGRGLHGLEPSARDLDAGNSGTTVRLLSGLLAGCRFESTFVGDESLSRRPMKRIIDPLRQFGATIQARDGNYLPLKILGHPLNAIDFTMPIPSAQVKSSVLLAGLQAQGVTTVHEPVVSRNHTEIALAEFGARIRVGENRIKVEGGHALRGKEFSVPGDPSAAAFFIAAAIAVPNSSLRLTGIGVNATRTGYMRLLAQMQARVTITQLSVRNGEPVGDVCAESSDIAGMDIGGSWIPNIIDEIPILAVLGTRTQNGIRFRDAAELRAKESDRIHAVARNLRALGAAVDSFGDHRIAMAFAIAGLFADGPVVIKDPACVSISFPGFFDLLNRVRV